MVSFQMVPATSLVKLALFTNTTPPNTRQARNTGIGQSSLCPQGVPRTYPHTAGYVRGNSEVETRELVDCLQWNDLFEEVDNPDLSLVAVGTDYHCSFRLLVALH
jgi:hypothetical protein